MFGEAIKVIGVNIKSKDVVIYYSITQSSLDGFSPSAVCRCCKGERKTHKGFIWRYYDECVKFR